MSDNDNALAHAFAGQWVGESMGCDSPAHLWEIKITTFGDTFRYASINTRWEGQVWQVELSPYVIIEGGVASLDFGNGRRSVWVDSQHFVIPNWDTNDIRGKKGRHYDVVFSRPGVAELSAKDAYHRYQAMRKRKRAAASSAES